ncbi:hypothetical protein PAXRUDRAFT_408494 [Paxillus rubicundulus Ve08.2h10]|uniref:Uncharacterized protein n=1 Tax=Paxillus rubicundulus Ve08.2h10 TaxID=930991 RepID=A0A0D0E2W0_9AGAM|nr:hypothetical protein PAXRUDRAFT_408494 [Paxillus rubicundulus Ve08.2h10]
MHIRTASHHVQPGGPRSDRCAAYVAEINHSSTLDVEFKTPRCHCPSSSECAPPAISVHIVILSPLAQSTNTLLYTVQSSHCPKILVKHRTSFSSTSLNPPPDPRPRCRKLPQLAYFRILESGVMVAPSESCFLGWI